MEKSIYGPTDCPKVSWDDPINVKEVYSRLGFLEITGILNADDLKSLHDAFDEALERGTVVHETDLVGSDEGNDAIFKHEVFEKLARNPKICSVVEALIGENFELQQSRLNCKPLKDSGGGQVPWHQDYPFFPHTNFDLVAVSIHLDEEDADSGPIRLISGSHSWGPLQHSENGVFKYKCTAELDFESYPSVYKTGPAGRVTIHHCLAVHTSAVKMNNNCQRRILVLRYRACDNVQLAGIIWRCTGYQIQNSGNSQSKYARFPDNTRVELRGANGRLFDLYQKLGPNT